MAESIRGCVLMADRHHSLTEGVRGLLETVFASVFIVADEASLLKGAEQLSPLLVIVDIAMADGDLTRLVSRIIARSPRSRILVLSVHDEPCVADAALRAGAHAIVVKGRIATDLMPTIDALVTSGV